MRRSRTAWLRVSLNPPHRVSHGLGCVPAGKLGGEPADQVGSQTNELHVTDQVFDTLVTTPVRLTVRAARYRGRPGAARSSRPTGFAPAPALPMPPGRSCSAGRSANAGHDLGCEAPRPHETVGSAVPGTPPQSSIASVFDRPALATVPPGRDGHRDPGPSDEGLTRVSSAL